MQVIPTDVPGAVIIEPKVFGDARGFFFEAHHAQRYADAGLPAAFVQANVSRSARGVLRGLHFQQPHPQGKLVYVLEGEVLDVAVDIRRSSAHFGRHASARLSVDNKRQFYVPPGFAHGFVVLSDYATFCYHCTETYQPEHDRGIAWNDPALGIDWGVAEPLLSGKDQIAPTLAGIDPALLPP